MKIIYKITTDKIDWSEVTKIFQLVGWGERPPNELKYAFSSSSYVRFAYDGEKLIGFGRTVDDGKYYAMIVDLIIMPEYQGKGIGSRILADLKNQLKDFYFTTLTSSVGKEAFYKKQGWKIQKTAFIWPRTEKQESEHTIKKITFNSN